MIFDLPLPPSANRMWRHARGRTYRSPEYESWRASCNYLVIAQRKGETIKARAKISIRYGKYHGAADGDNFLKPTCDLMQLAGAVLNDKQFRDWHPRDDWDAVPAGRMVVEVLPL
jgi:Holliday junction resolvase RusA-like endonuclease